MPQELNEILGEDGPLARAVPGFRPRAAQQQLAAHVARCIEERGWLVAEAGTGIGKTFAYLVPALLSGRRIIISTGTRTLQDQLFHRDLPLLASALGRAATVALLKGRANYLCLDRLRRLPSELPLESALERGLGGRVASWAQSTIEGDLAELVELSDGHPLRERITSTRDSCTANRCADFARCHVFAARRRANDADIVVVNHHLLLADLALKEEGYGDILPSADAVILDEAHQLPELAGQFFGTSFNSRKIDQLLSDLPALLLESGFEPRRLAPEEARLRTAQVAAQKAAQSAAGNARVAWEENLPAVDATLRAVVEALCELADALQGLQSGDAIVQAALRATEIAGTLDEVLDTSIAEGARLLGASARGFNCQVVPFNVGALLRNVLTARPMAWVFTSATLSVAGDFSHYISRLGIEDRCEQLRIGSPFDYGNQALLYVPADMPDPSSPEYMPAVVRSAAGLVEMAGGGTFLLFTSHRALEHAARSLREQWKSRAGGSFHLLVQGEAPREQLLREFREHGDAVLLGTSSFWEGVDVRGSALRLVVIDRLPFASPDDPVTRARARQVREQGGNPFQDFQLPEAALALQQGVGRLIRSETDTGVVAIFDPRLYGKGYGRKLLDALPPMKRTRSLADVRDMLSRCA
ncbi:MAG: ATP-dependent DNA helicase [Proteobacteria bacterium]|nr:ATP-dependent DNA helicase [Pseudomonadota bacterium]